MSKSIDHMSDIFDLAVIGGGVIGCALARRFTLDGARVVVMEKAADLLDGASKGNSGILHTGFDAPVGSLEQACVAAGQAEYYAIRDSLGLPLLETGALVLAWTAEEEDRLGALLDQAHANGVTSAHMLSKQQILEREPALSPTLYGGFLVPDEHVIDPWTAPHLYMLQAIKNGAVLRRNCAVTGGLFDGEIWRLDSSHGTVKARTVISATGLYGDWVEASLLGTAPYQIRPRKGQFVVFDKAAAALTRSILLPVPTATTKGVVVCRTAYGNLLVGPTAEEQDSRTDASVDRDALEGLRNRGMAILPDLARMDITATYAGLRPATEEKHYRITNRPDLHYIGIGGIRSTGLSAALGLARHARSLMDDWGRPPGWKPIPDAVQQIPRLPSLCETEQRDWETPDHGEIICHCELVTRREIELALNGPMPVGGLGGLKRRTRVTMGRCQGFYCMGALAALTAGKLDPPLAEPHGRPGS